MNYLFIASVFICISQVSFGQNDNDLFRYSKTTYYGTARFEAMGGSFGALGADLSSSQINPAGYGRYSSSQVGLSVYGGLAQNDATFQSVLSKSKESHGGISTFALVLTEDKSMESTGFLYTQWGFGFNQVEKFKNTFTYEGQQYESLLDGFVDQAQGYFPEELNDYFAFSTDLAYNTSAIKYDNVNQSYYSLLNINGDMYHNRTVETEGGIGEYFLSYSVNYLNKLYLGANVGLRSLRYSDYYSHNESLTDTSDTPLRSFNYEYQFTTKGHGFNLKLGGIYLISEAFRLGLALQSSTLYDLTDNYVATMSSTFEDSVISISDSENPTGNYKYKLRNPGKIIGSVAYIFGTKGCINVDIEYTNYKRARFKSTNDAAYEPYDYKYENEIAKEVFQDAVNVRIGAEWVVVPGIYLRGGFGYYGNAYNTEQNVELKPELLISGGLGFKTKRLTFDASYRQRMYSLHYFAFPSSSSEISTNVGIIVLSGSFNF